MLGVLYDMMNYFNDNCDNLNLEELKEFRDHVNKKIENLETLIKK